MVDDVASTMGGLVQRVGQRGEDEGGRGADVASTMVYEFGYAGETMSTFQLTRSRFCHLLTHLTPQKVLTVPTWRALWFSATWWTTWEG